MRTHKSFGDSLISMRNSFAVDSAEKKDSHKFGDFRFETDSRLLWRNGSLVPLTPRSAELLNALLQRRGEVLSRDELIDRVWKDTFVEEGNLNYTISQLRKVLNSNGNTDEFIQTVPRRGYRFIDDPHATEIVFENHSLTETVIEEIHTSSPDLVAIPRKRSAPVARTAVVMLSLAAIVIAAIALAVTWRANPPATGAASPGVRSIAVLPFKTADGDSDHRGLGLADVVITRLSGMSEISVRPTSAVMAFENQAVDAVKVGQELQADAVLDGMIHRTTDTVHVTARLVRVADGAALWSGVFEKPASDQMSIDSEIVAQLANALSLNRASATASDQGRPYTTHADAYQLYVRGRYEWNKRDQQGLHEAQRLFRNAIDADPNFALAYVGLADSLAFENETQELNDSLVKALALDPNLGEAYATYAFTLALHQWRWKEAEENFKKAIELSPGYATAHHWYATLLGIQGRSQEAEAEMKRALEINPLSHNFIADLGQVYYFQRDYEKAEDYSRRALAIDPDFVFAHWHLENIYWRTARSEKAIDELVTRIEIDSRSKGDGSSKPFFEKSRNAYRNAYRKGGLEQFVRAYNEDYGGSAFSARNPNTPFSHARWFTMMGRKDDALDNLDKAYEQRAFLMAWVKADPIFDELRDEPRYQAILRKMGLE